MTGTTCEHFQQTRLGAQTASCPDNGNTNNLTSVLHNTHAGRFLITPLPLGADADLAKARDAVVTGGAEGWAKTAREAAGAGAGAASAPVTLSLTLRFQRGGASGKKGEGGDDDERPPLSADERVEQHIDAVRRCAGHASHVTTDLHLRPACNRTVALALACLDPTFNLIQLDPQPQFNTTSSVGETVTSGGQH